MALQYTTPLVFGVMLVVAVGTLAYSWWNTKNKQQDYSYGNSRNSFDCRYDTKPDEGKNDGERKRKRRAVEQCSICLDELTTNIVKLPCLHAFHRSCISLWIRKKNTCPNCRTASNTKL